MDKQLKLFAKSITLTCVREGSIEKFHQGRGAYSKTGDYTDVTVVTPFGEIPWNEVIHISQEEMKKLMQEIVNKIYTVLANIDNEEFIIALTNWGGGYTPHWDTPEYLPDFVLSNNPRKRRSRAPKHAKSVKGVLATQEDAEKKGGPLGPPMFD
jgi:hypothetical protein